MGWPRTGWAANTERTSLPAGMAETRTATKSASCVTMNLDSGQPFSSAMFQTLRRAAERRRLIFDVRDGSLSEDYGSLSGPPQLRRRSDPVGQLADLRRDDKVRRRPARLRVRRAGRRPRPARRRSGTWAVFSTRRWPWIPFPATSTRPRTPDSTRVFTGYVPKCRDRPLRRCSALLLKVSPRRSPISAPALRSAPYLMSNGSALRLPKLCRRCRATRVGAGPFAGGGDVRPPRGLLVRQRPQSTSCRPAAARKGADLGLRPEGADELALSSRRAPVQCAGQHYGQSPWRPHLLRGRQRRRVPARADHAGEIFEFAQNNVVLAGQRNGLTWRFPGCEWAGASYAGRATGSSSTSRSRDHLCDHRALEGRRALTSEIAQRVMIRKLASGQYRLYSRKGI